jgi:hypothetical protein
MVRNIAVFWFALLDASQAEKPFLARREAVSGLRVGE